jgi:hypothetical protein
VAQRVEPTAGVMRACSQASRIGLDCSGFSTVIHRHG